MGVKMVHLIKETFLSLPALSRQGTLHWTALPPSVPDRLATWKDHSSDMTVV